MVLSQNVKRHSQSQGGWIICPVKRERLQTDGKRKALIPKEVSLSVEVFIG